MPSNFRQVPDNTELFVDSSSNDSAIIEIVEMADIAANEAMARFAL